MGKSVLGLALKQVCPRGPYLDHYHFWFTLMICLTIYQQLLSSLQMIRPFFIVQNVNTFANHLNSDLSKISIWSFQWKLSFNPYSSKQTQEVVFSHKLQKTCHPSIYFNKKSVKQVPSQRHLLMILDTKLNF